MSVATIIPLLTLVNEEFPAALETVTVAVSTAVTMALTRLYFAVGMPEIETDSPT